MLEGEVTKSREVSRPAEAEPRPMIDGVSKGYAVLGADPTVKKARSELSRTAKVGPFDAFKAGVKSRDSLERKALEKKPLAAPGKATRAMR